MFFLYSGPFWDANETWLVLGVGILLIAFPQAHGIILSALYLPVSIMLFGLILRGVAFDFRIKARDQHKQLWNNLFFIGSLVASTAQGWMLGAYITGLNNSINSILFSFLISLSLPMLYIMLASAWLLMKTEGQLFNKSIEWRRLAIMPFGVALLIISIATPLASSAIAERWFSLPYAIGLLPIPLITLLLYSALILVFFSKKILVAGYVWIPFACLLFICVMSTIGIAYSLFPDIIIGRMQVWQAAAHVESLKMIFIGTVITLPMILTYTIYIYKIFHGKSTELSYGYRQP